MKLNLKKSWGRVDYINVQRGFGFLRDNKDDQCLWFHYSALKPESARPIIGRMAIYSLSENQHGPIAINVFILTGEEKNLDEIVGRELGEDAAEILNAATEDGTAESEDTKKSREGAL